MQTYRNMHVVGAHGPWPKGLKHHQAKTLGGWGDLVSSMLDVCVSKSEGNSSFSGTK